MNVKDNYYHITSTENIQSIIERGGLICQTGENCKADNDNRKSIYFVEGIEALYVLASRFLKLTDSKNATDVKKFNEQEFLRGELAKNDEEMNRVCYIFSKKDGVFDKFVEMLKNSTFFQLDLEDGIDFVKNGDVRMTKSNISKDKINKIIVDGKENSNAYDFLIYVYANFKDELWDKEQCFGGDKKYYLKLLDGFMQKEIKKDNIKHDVEFCPISKQIKDKDDSAR